MPQRGDEVVGFTPPKFKHDDPEMLAYLEEHGYAVVEKVADDQQVARAHDDFWSFHEGIGTQDGAMQVLRDDPTTWGGDFLPHPATGIITGYGFGQSRFCWNLRTLPAVPEVFKSIWETDDILTSFDGGAAFRPWSAGDTEWRTQGGWWHCDQNATRPNRSGRVCVQGLVQLTPANEYTGGFCVIPGSHKGHEAFSRRHPSAHQQGDFLIVPDGDRLLREAAGFYLLRANPGDLILWDSRTIHCNGPALKPPESAPADVHVPRVPHELLRLVGYVCCTPTSFAEGKKIIARRAQAAIEKTTSTHWPHSFVPTGYRPPWEKARSLADYSELEARLILGKNGVWPEQYVPRGYVQKPAKALTLKATPEQVHHAVLSMQAAAASASSAGPASAREATKKATTAKTEKRGSGVVRVASKAVTSRVRPPLTALSSGSKSVSVAPAPPPLKWPASASTRAPAASAPASSLSNRSSARSSGAASNAPSATGASASRRIGNGASTSAHANRTAAGAGTILRPEMKKGGSKGLLGRLMSASPRG